MKAKKILEEQLFVAHTFKDINQVKVNRIIQKIFADSGVKPFIASMETWRRENNPDWLWIQQEIARSKALILFITSNILHREYTQNWIAFETGIAATLAPRKPVWIFQIARVNFRIPYLTHYILMPESVLKKGSRGSKDSALRKLVLELRIMHLRAVIRNPEVSFGVDLRCSKCKLYFKFYDFSGTSRNIPCPCCSTNISVPETETQMSSQLCNNDILHSKGVSRFSDRLKRSSRIE